MHSKGPTKQYLYTLEPHHGCLYKVKKASWCPLIKEGQLSHKNENCAGTPMYTTTRDNREIKINCKKRQKAESVVSAIV